MTGTTMHAGADTTHRLFFALWPDDEVRGAIHDRAQAIEAGCVPGGRPQAAGRYHMTLQFLGTFRPLPVATVDSAIVAADTIRMPAFTLVLDHAGNFDRSRAWWLGCAASSALQSLHGRLGAALSAVGLHSPDAAPHAPHVTLGRNPARKVQEHPIEPVAWPVGDFVLVDSAAGAPAYRIVRRWPLEPVNRGS